MKKNSILFCKCFLGLFSFILISCTDIDLSNISKDVEFNESLVLPIGEGTISVKDLLSKFDTRQYVEYDADTVNFVTSSSEEYLFEGIDLLKNASAKNLSFSPASSQISAYSSLGINAQSSVELGLNSNPAVSRVDSAEISAGSFGVKVSVTDIKDASNVDIRPSDLNVRLVFSNMHYPNSSSPITKDVTVDLFGVYKTVAIDNFVMNANGITGIPFQIQFLSGNRIIKLGSNAKIDVEIKFDQLDYKVAYGFYEPKAVKSTVLKHSLADLADFPTGVKLANPKIMMSLESNIGSYLRYNIDYVKAYTKDRQTQTNGSFNGSASSAIELIDKKPIPGLTIVKDLRTLDNVYGSLDDVFDTNASLDTLEYKFTVQADQASPAPSFIVPNMKLKANFKLVCPAYMKAGSYYNYNDTIDSIGDAMSNMDKLESALLVIDVTNALPVNVVYRMSFLDSSNTPILNSSNLPVYNDSTVINSSQVNDAVKGLTVNPVKTQIKIQLTSEQIALLKNATSMVYSIKLTGQDNTKAIQITKNNYFKVKLGAFVKGKYATNLDSIK